MNSKTIVLIAAVINGLSLVFFSTTGCSPEGNVLPGDIIKAGLKAGCNGCEIRRIPTEGESEGEAGEGEITEGESSEGEIMEEGEGENPPGDLFSVPQGTFKMGRPYDDVGDSMELPVHTVSLDGYRIGKYEVTNREFVDALNWAYERKLLKNNEGTAYNGGTIYAYGQPIAETGETSSNAQILYSQSTFSIQMRPDFNGQSLSMENHPVIMVSWYGAAAYCNWRSTMQGLQPCYDTTDWTLNRPARNGFRLPTEAEWERAAAWDGTRHWRYGITNDTNDPTWSNHIEINPLWLKVYPYTSPAGWYDGIHPAQVRYPDIITQKAISPVGAYDMTGNVLEWCYDWYQGDYYAQSPDANPAGPAEGMFRVARGGSWSTSTPDCRTARRFRYVPASRENNLGFRVLLPQ